MGVFKENGKYRARFYRNGQAINVGTFKTKQEAQVALEKARGSIDVVPDQKMEDRQEPLVLHPTPPPTLWQKIKARFKK